MVAALAAHDRRLALGNTTHLIAAATGCGERTRPARSRAYRPRCAAASGARAIVWRCGRRAASARLLVGALLAETRRGVAHCVPPTSAKSAPGLFIAVRVNHARWVRRGDDCVTGGILRGRRVDHRRRVDGSLWPRPGSRVSHRYLSVRRRRRRARGRRRNGATAGDQKENNKV